MNCENVREKLLDHLYEALEEEEERAVVTHVLRCAACRVALDAARADKEALAEASRLDLPDLEFHPPAKKRGRVVTFRRLAAVAAVLVALAGLWLYRERMRAPVLAANPRLTVEGPSSIPCDAGSVFVLRTLTIDGDPVPAAIRAQVWTGEDRPVFDRTLHSDADGRTRVEFPGGLGEPGSALGVSFLAVYEGGEERLATTVALEPSPLAAYVNTDKPLYRPGEQVRARGVVLTRFALTPAGRVPLLWKLLDAQDTVVREWPETSEAGVGSTAVQLPGDVPGGRYRLELSHPKGAFPKAEREFTVRSYRVPRLKTDLELGRESYGPGDEVTGLLSVTRAEGGAPAGATAEFTATVDGTECFRSKVTLEPDGSGSASFRLPGAIEEGRAQLACTITDGGTVETAAETIPITLDRLKVDLLPEGGHLVAGLENRVYFAVRDMKDEPAELVADLIDSDGRTVAEAKTDILGMGRFALNPKGGESYRLRARSPAGVTLDGEPITVVTEGVVFRPTWNINHSDKGLSLRVASTFSGDHRFEVWCRGRVVANKLIQLVAGRSAGVFVEPDSNVGGVFRVTVFDPSGRPRAERLISRVPSRRIRTEITTGKPAYAPGEEVKVSVVTRDEHGNGTAATLGISVVDDAVLTLANESDKAPLPLHFLLGMEVEELEEVELFAESAEGARAVDLLLGVQGWRRFAWKEPESFLAANPVAGPIVLPASPADLPAISLDSLETAEAGAKPGFAHADRRTTFVAGWLLLAAGILGVGIVLFRVQQTLGVLRPVVGFGAAAAGVLLMVVIALEVVPVTTNPTGGDDVAVDLIVKSTLPSNNQEVLPGLGDGYLERIAVPNFSGILLDEPVNWVLSEPVNWQYRWAYNGDVPLALYYGTGSHIGVVDEAAVYRGSWDDTFNYRSTEFQDGVTVRFSGLPRNSTEVLSRLTDPSLGGVIQVRFSERVLKSTITDRINVFGLRDVTVDAIGHGGWRSMRIDGILTVSGGYFNEYFRPYTPWTREYRHVNRPSPDETRRDFTEVLYWHPRLVTDANGKAEFTFQTCDSITSFRIGVEANDRRGALASDSTELTNRLPFWIEPKLPVELGAGDRLLLPVTVANETDETMAAQVTLDGSAPASVEVQSGGRGRVTFDLIAVGRSTSVKLEGVGPKGNSDRVEKVVPVVPSGYPMQVDRAGVLDREASTTLLLAAAADRRTLRGSLRLYPSITASLTDGVESMLRSPGGCFEQASSSTYPNVLILACLSESGVGSPAIARKAKEYLRKGYDLLAGYECKGGGFEWFGGNPAHEALTAYGIMEFTEMATYIDVDAEMLARTKEWLLSRRDGKGGFLGDGGSHTFGDAPREIHDAYITWALTEAGVIDDLGTELDLLEKRARESDDPYLIALAVIALHNADRPAADALAKKLADLQEEDGSLVGSSTSITASRDQNLAVETTALSIQAFLRCDRQKPADRAMTWLAGCRRQGGNFGATQATVLALKALVDYARATGAVTCAHDLTLFVNGKSVAQREVPEGAKGVILFERELLDALTPGKNEIAIVTTGEESLPYLLSLEYSSTTPPSNPDCAVRIRTSLAKESVTEGGTVGLTVEIENREEAGVPMVVARVGLPAGLIVRAKQLEELKDAGEFAWYETRPREVTLYFRGLKAEGTKSVRLDLIADIPGEFTGPASSAYLYYTDDEQDWTAPLAIRIAAAK